MIVIDIGCARYGGDYSIERLIEEFHPDVLYGFDPHSSLAEIEIDGDIGDTIVSLKRKAAWTFDGEVGYREDGLNSWVTDDPTAPKVPCFDLARFIEELPETEIVLKIDAEGSEYDLLSHLILTGADERLSLVWCEWHMTVENAEARRRVIEAEMCEIREWTY